MLLQVEFIFIAYNNIKLVNPLEFKYRQISLFTLFLYYNGITCYKYIYIYFKYLIVKICFFFYKFHQISHKLNYILYNMIIFINNCHCVDTCKIKLMRIFLYFSDTKILFRNKHLFNIYFKTIQLWFYDRNFYFIIKRSFTYQILGHFILN